MGSVRCGLKPVLMKAIITPSIRLPGALAFGLFQVAAPAQESYKVLRDQVDEFDGHRVVEVGMLPSGTGPNVRWLAHDDRLSLMIPWNFSGREAVAVLERDPLLIKLENGAVLTLFSDSSVAAIPTRDVHGSITCKGTFSYAISKREVEELTRNWVTKFRMVFTSTSMEFDGSADPTWQYAFARSAKGFHAVVDGSPMQPVVQGVPNMIVKPVVYGQ